jgi:pimeloyl-ACP methyl ester carboxylesterase
MTREGVASASTRIVSEAVTISSRNGSVLYGVVSRPAVQAPHPKAVIICASGFTRTGLGDVMRWVGESLAQRGFLVLRFDPIGTGDSPGGELADDVPLSEYARKVQGGAFTDNIEDTVRWVQRAYGTVEVCLLGVCGPCASVLLVAAAMPDIVSDLVLLTPPVLYSARGEGEIVRDYDAPIRWRGYSRRLLDPVAYGNFFTGQSEYRAIGTLFRWAFRKAADLARRAVARLDRSARPSHPDFNQRFWEGFRAVMACGKPVLFLLAELDNETPEFYAEFKEPVLDRHRAYARLCRIQNLPGTDHSLMAEEGRVLTLDTLLGWLRSSAGSTQVTRHRAAPSASADESRVVGSMPVALFFSGAAPRGPHRGNSKES